MTDTTPSAVIEDPTVSPSDNIIGSDPPGVDCQNDGDEKGDDEDDVDDDEEVVRSQSANKKHKSGDQ